MARQSNTETSAALMLCIAGAIDMDFPVVFFNNRVDQSQAQSSALARVFGGEERLE